MKREVVRLVIVGVMAIIAGGAQALSAYAATIQFDLNGVAPVVHTESGSGSTKVPTIELDFNNITFTGWNTSPTGNGKSYDEGDTINNSTTLYAQWADGTHIGGGTVDPDPGGGEEPGGGEDPDPDPGEDEEYAQLSDLNVITVTVDGKLLSSFNPLTNGTYTVPSGSNIRLNLNNLNLNVWSYTQSQPSSNTLTFTMTGKTQSGNLVVTYTFKAEAEEPDPDPDPNPNPGGGEEPGGDEGEDPNPDDGNQDEGDKSNQDTNPDSDNDPNHDSNPAPGTITGDVSGGSNNGSNGTGDTGRQDTALSPGSPTAGFINLTTLSNIETAAPLAAIASGTLAVLAVLLLTNKEAKKVKQASSKRHNNKATKVKAFFTTLTHNKARLTIASISALAILAGSFYLINTNTNAATDTDSEDWGIYVDDEGVPYEGYVTIVPDSGKEVDKITTWWKGGKQQSGETFRNDAWSFFDPTDSNRMARGRDVFLPTEQLPDRWVRYDDYGAMVKGETVKDDNWYYFDEQTGAMAKGLTTLPSGKTVYYDKITGIMMKGWWEAEGRTWHSDLTTGQIHPFYEDGQGAGALQNGQAIAELAIRLAPTADGYSNPIRLGSGDRAWDKISNPEAQEYIRTMELVTEPYTDNYTANPALASCTQAAGHVIRATVDPDAYIQDTAIFRNYLDSSPRWEYLGNLAANESLDSGRLQPGDILTTENNVHTIIYLGNALVRQAYPNSTANTFEADYSVAQYPHLATHTTYPRANGDTFRIYRYKGKSGATDHRYVNIWRYLGGDGSWDLGNN